LPHDQTATLRQLEAVDALRGVGLILHAGDIGNLEIIENPKTIAKVYAVRGNNTRAPGPTSFRRG
jgi:predicted phosphodiesterase